MSGSFVYYIIYYRAVALHHYLKSLVFVHLRGTVARWHQLPRSRKQRRNPINLLLLHCLDAFCLKTNWKEIHWKKTNSILMALKCNNIPSQLRRSLKSKIRARNGKWIQRGFFQLLFFPIIFLKRLFLKRWQVIILVSFIGFESMNQCRHFWRQPKVMRGTFIESADIKILNFRTLCYNGFSFITWSGNFIWFPLMKFVANWFMTH